MTRWTLLLISALLLIIHLTFADVIYVSGDVSGIWSADTVFVIGEVRVPPGETLVIQPGVKVLFWGHYSFNIMTNAMLIANGIEGDSIHFTALNQSAGWGGLIFTSAAQGCSLSFCVLKYGKTSNGGAINTSSSNLIIKHCRVAYCTATTTYGTAQGGGISCTNNSNLSLIHCVVSNCSTRAVGSYCRAYGGAIYAENSILTLNHCTIRCNDMYVSGYESWGSTDGVYAGNNTEVYISSCFFDTNPDNLWCQGNSAIINSNYFYNCWRAIEVYGCIYNAICGNIILNCAGGITNSYGETVIKNNIIKGNYYILSGKGIHSSSPYVVIISSNIVSDKLNAELGGGILIGGYNISTNNTLISHNILRNNTNTNSSEGGAGILISDANPIVCYNVIENNHSNFSGAGIEIEGGGSVLFFGNVLVNNVASHPGGGFYSEGSNSQHILINNILLGNSLPQIYTAYGSTISITYSDIQDALWPGLGNITTYPSFVDTANHDYRLLWGSPCIDSGDPNPVFNNPDGTRSDMGAFYYDQNTPVRILLSPLEIPYLIPEVGGYMYYILRFFNRDQVAHQITAWCDVTIPDSTIQGPVLGPVTMTIPAGGLVARFRTQHVPAPAPMGVYFYNAYAIVDGDTSKDSFMWGKLGQVALGAADWTNSGEELTSIGVKIITPNTPTKFALYPASPNPFNPTTNIRFDLPQTCRVTLKIFDISGRLVASPLQGGWREAGTHAVTFDGSRLSSGVYLYILKAGEYQATGKLVLMK